MKKRYVIALVIVIAGLITLWRILNAPVPTYQTLIVRPGDLQQSVLATGKLTRCVRLTWARRSAVS